MPTEIVTSLISSVIGGLLVAIVNYFFTRKKTQAETEKLKAEADKIKAEAEKVRVEIGRLNTTVEEASYLVAATTEQVIYDGTKVTGIEDYDIIGQAEVKNGILVLTDGGFRLRKYTYNGQATDFLPKNEVITRRTLRVGFESKVTQGKYVIILIFETLERDKLEMMEVIVDQTEWKKTNLYFRLPPDKDSILCFFLHPISAGSFQMRNLVLAERAS